MATNLTIMEDKDLEIIEKREQSTMREMHEELDRISKLGGGLNDADRAFVRARTSYLTPQQREMWADVLSEKPTKSKSQAKREAIQNEASNQENAGEGDIGENETSELSNLSYKELQERATSLGIRAVGVARPELERLVAEAESQA
jgi:hypothetical protein